MLFRYHDEHQAPFWATVGGELQQGETFETAASRELLEETGFRDPIGKFLRSRKATYPIANSAPTDWVEKYFLVQLGVHLEPTNKNWTQEELSTIIAWKWWSVGDMNLDPEQFKPNWLPDLLSILIEEAVK